MGQLAPNLEKWVQKNIQEMRTPMKEKTMFGPAGRQVLHSDGEATLLDPWGRKIRVIERHGGNTMETEDDGDTHISVNVRPAKISLGMTVKGA